MKCFLYGIAHGGLHGSHWATLRPHSRLTGSFAEQSSVNMFAQLASLILCSHCSRRSRLGFAIQAFAQAVGLTNVSVARTMSPAVRWGYFNLGSRATWIVRSVSTVCMPVPMKMWVSWSACQARNYGKIQFDRALVGFGSVLIWR